MLYTGMLYMISYVILMLQIVHVKTVETWAVSWIKTCKLLCSMLRVINTATTG